MSEINTAALSEEKVIDKDVIAAMDKIGKSVHECRDSLTNGLKEASDKWADESIKNVETLNALKDTQEKQAKSLEALEIMAARIGDTDKKAKGFISKDVRDQILEVQRWAYTPKEDYRQDVKEVDAYIKTVMENKPAMAYKYSCFDEFKKDVIESVLPLGGYWVLPYTYLNDTIQRIFETSPMRSICRVQNINKPIAFEVIDDQQAGEPSTAQENNTIAETDTPEVGQVTFHVHNISAILKVSDQMLQDSNRDMGQWVVEKGTSRIMRTQNTAFISGSGSNTAKGILAYDKWGDAATDVGLSTTYETDKLQYILSAAANALSYNGLVNLQNALLEDYQSQASFLMHRLTWGQILQLTDTQDRPLFQFMNLLSTGADGMPLLGRKVTFAADLVAPVGAGGTFSDGNAPIIYGDFKEGYSIFDRMGFQILRDEITGSQDFRVRYVIKTRFGGGATSYDRLKILEVGAPLSLELSGAPHKIVSKLSPVMQKKMINLSSGKRRIVKKEVKSTKEVISSKAVK